MKTRVLYLDILRTCSIIAVIIFHVIENTINTLHISGTAGTIYMAASKLLYFAVPMFILISGSLFLNPDKEIPIEKLYKKYISRILICLVSFGMFYSILEIYFTEKSFSFGMMTKSIQNIFTGNLWAHMWYLYLILGLYIISPLLKIFVKNASKQVFEYVLIVLFIFTVFLPDVTAIFKITTSFNAVITSAYVLLFLIGFYISKYDLPKNLKSINYILSLAFIVATIVNQFNNYFDMSFISYTSISTFSITIALFTLCKDLSKGKESGKIIKAVSECSFGIYLIHQMFINIIYKLLKINFINVHPYIGLVSYVVAIFGASFIVVYILRKIPFVKKYIL